MYVSVCVCVCCVSVCTCVCVRTCVCTYMYSVLQLCLPLMTRLCMVCSATHVQCIYLSNLYSTVYTYRWQGGQEYNIYMYMYMYMYVRG